MKYFIILALLMSSQVFAADECLFSIQRALESADSVVETFGEKTNYETAVLVLNSESRRIGNVYSSCEQVYRNYRAQLTSFCSDMNAKIVQREILIQANLEERKSILYKILSLNEEARENVSVVCPR